MERAKSSKNFHLEINNQKPFLVSLILTLIFHSLLLFGDTLRRRHTLNYSNNKSQVVSVRIKHSRAQKVQEKKPVLKKKLKKVAKKKVPKKVAPVKEILKEQKVSNQEVAMNSGEATARAKYLSHVRELINEYKVYPRMAKRLKHQGRVKIKLIIDSDGHLVSAEIIEKAQSSLLNKATQQIFEKVHSFGKIPAEILERPMEVVIPIRYELI